MDIAETVSALASEDETTPDWFPYLGTLSSAGMYRFVVVPNVEPSPPEYVYLTPPSCHTWNKTWVTFDLAMVEWNSAWESGPLTPGVVDSRRFPKQLRWLLRVQDRNLRLVPRFPDNRYEAYAPLYHLLPASVLQAVQLPLLKRGLWPHWISQHHRLTAHLPSDFDARLSEAFSRHIWPLLNSRSARFAFAADDPVRILSHHLDFWLPYIDVVAQRRTRLNERCAPDKDDDTYQRDVERLIIANADAGVQFQRPLRGGPLWMGEDEALDAAQELVDVADEHGALRSIVDAVRSHRIQDDFSSVWSYEREDFERKLHRKRAKVKVVFTEMPDTVPVHSEDAEVHERLLWGDFITLLDAKERRVAVCLRRGVVGPVDIAKELGYANHSPVSKALARVRQKASAFFDSH